MTLYISHQGRRFSMDASFLHTPPPRHTRLAWPATESFDINPAEYARKPSGIEIPRIFGGDGGHPVDTTLVLCTMFKDEAPYLEEWLQYHLLLGVRKVSIYSCKRPARPRCSALQHTSIPRLNLKNTTIPSTFCIRIYAPYQSRYLRHPPIHIPEGNLV